MPELRQSTAASFPAGPFLDGTNGSTPETGLAISASDVRLSKNGATIAAMNSSTSPEHMAAGYYKVEVDTTDTGTLGTAYWDINMSGALPVWGNFSVVTANYWDTKYGVDRFQSDLWEIEGVSVSTSAALLGINVVNWAATVMAVGNLLSASDVVTTGPIAASNINGTVAMSTLQTAAAAVSASNLLSASDLIAASTIVDGVWDEDIIAAHNTASTAGALLDDLNTPATFKATVTNLDVAVSTRQAATAAVSASDLLTASTLVDNIWDEDIVNAHNTASTAGALLDDLNVPANFMATVTNLDVAVSTRLASTAAVSGSDLLSASDLLAASTIVDAVWDEDIIAAHNTASTAGALLDDLNTPATFKATVTNLDVAVSSRLAATAAVSGSDLLSASDLLAASTIADNVWDEDIIAAHNTASTAGALLDDLNTPANFMADVTSLATATGIISGSDVLSASNLIAASTIGNDILSRSASEVQTTSACHSLTTLILMATESQISGSDWTIYRVDGTTNYRTMSASLDDSASAIVGVT